jgi:uncharacterized protein YbjT (DUF2867 family)
MRIWISGATGFVGYNIVKKLLQHNHEVIAFVRNSVKAKVVFSQLPSNGKLVIKEGNILDYQSIFESIDKDTKVAINTVGIIYQTPEQSFLNMHYIGVKNIVFALTQKGINRFIHISALGTRDNASSQYHKSKFLGEKTIIESGLNYTIFRPSVIYGVGDGFTKKVLEMLNRPLILPLPAGGQNLLQPVYIDDLVNLVFDSLSNENTYNKIIDVVGPDIIRFRDIILKVKELKKIGFRIPISVPLFVLKIVAYFAEKFQETPLITKDQLIMLKEDNISVQNELQKIFPHIKFTSFHEGMKKVLENWYIV